jgi:hypothetical protein
MMFSSQIERDLFAYLSAGKQQKVQDYLDALEDDPLTQCPACFGVIADGESFCDEKCRGEFMEGEDGKEAGSESRLGSGSSDPRQAD